MHEGASSPKRSKMNGSVDYKKKLTQKIYQIMETSGEVFFVIKLNEQVTAASNSPITDPDHLIPSKLLESRDSFLQRAREKQLEFSSLRRAKYSTMVIIHELHNEHKLQCSQCWDLNSMAL